MDYFFKENKFFLAAVVGGLTLAWLVDIFVITPLNASDLPFDLAAGVTAFGYDLAPDGIQFQNR